MLFSILYSIIIQQITIARSATMPQCNVIFHYNFENCGNESATNKIKTKVAPAQCINNDICKQDFNITYIQLMPYYKVRTVISDMLSNCCGKCAKLITINNFTNMGSTSIETLDTSDIVYPFLGNRETQQLHGFYFIPIFNIPSAYIISLKKQSPKETLLKLIKACAELWPLLLICLLMTFISGFVAWILETWNNEHEFPRPFHIGIFEGFWWSFVSMTTVGYGDKTPKSWPARAFSVFWILIGITICSMFTASLTTEITTAMTPETPEIAGKKIGWLKDRLYEATMIAQHGGILYGVDDNNFLSGIKKLFKNLSNGSIEGIVLDVYLYNLFKKELLKPSEALLRNYVVNKTTHREILNNGEKLAFGMLVKELRHGHYFRKYFIDNQLQVETCNMLKLNHVQQGEEEEEDNMLFSIDAGVFWPFFGGTVGILGLICIFGLFFEIKRKRDIIAAKNKENVESKM